MICAVSVDRMLSLRGLMLKTLQGGSAGRFLLIAPARAAWQEQWHHQLHKLMGPGTSGSETSFLIDDDRLSCTAAGKATSKPPLDQS